MRNVRVPLEEIEFSAVRSQGAGGHLAGLFRQEFEDFLRYGLLDKGFVGVWCDGSRHKRLVAFSYKRRDFCPGCGTRRMGELAAHLVDHVFPAAPVR